MRSLPQAELARRTGVTKAYVNAMINGRQWVSGEWCDRIGDALRLSVPERQRLHRAAARDRGYNV